MRRCHILLITFLAVLGFSPDVLASDPAKARVVEDSVRIFFIQSKIDLVPDLHGNREALDGIERRLRDFGSDSIYTLRHVSVVGGASPEGSIAFNQWLSENRAATLFKYLSSKTLLPDSVCEHRFLGRDWNGLLAMVEADPDMPMKQETLRLVRIIVEDTANGKSVSDPLQTLKNFGGGVPYRYMYRNMFPTLRSSAMNLWFELRPNPLITYIPLENATDAIEAIAEEQELRPLPGSEKCTVCKPFYMDIRTNMLYDVLALPSLGAEFYLGKNLSIAGMWTYGWWKTDRRHRYWRAYGGDLALRWWFGKEARIKPLTGHHLGIYGQLLTYDFEWGGKGYLGGKPGGTLWDKWNWGAGVEYGYSLPIARRLNIDFSLGLGYISGIYHTYLPEDNCYVWQSTHKRRWFGPTKLEVSLVWLIGCDNYNRRKGGKR